MLPPVRLGPTFGSHAPVPGRTVMGLAVGLKAAAAGVGTLGVATLLQVVGDAPEPLTTALQHSAGAGAFATVAVWLVLKGRVDGHGAQLKKLEDGQSQMAVARGRRRRCRVSPRARETARRWPAPYTPL